MIESRVVASELRLLADQGERRVISGLAMPYGQVSASRGVFCELTSPGAFAEAATGKRLILAGFGSLIVGGTRDGSLVFRETRAGLRFMLFETSMACHEAPELFEQVERGDLDTLTCYFKSLDESWLRTRRDYPLRVIQRARLRAIRFTAAGDPDAPVDLEGAELGILRTLLREERRGARRERLPASATLDVKGRLAL